MKQQRNDITALHTTKISELESQLRELEVQLAQARLAKVAGKLKDTATIKRTSDAIARIKTVMREQALVAGQDQEETTEAKDEK